MTLERFLTLVEGKPAYLSYMLSGFPVFKDLRDGEVTCYDRNLPLHILAKRDDNVITNSDEIDKYLLTAKLMR